MPALTLSFEVHQPFRLNRNVNRDLLREKKLSLEELEDRYFNHAWNRTIFERVAEKCYLPANASLLENLDRYPKEFKVSFSLSGVFLEQCERWGPDVLDSFRELARRKEVELLDQTYYHSLAGLFPEEGEFIEQVEAHREAMRSFFHRTPAVFENTEFLYNNRIARIVEEMGYLGIFTEGAERVLGWRSPNYLYWPEGCDDLKVLLRNYRLSDDVAFRFSSRDWREYPLTAEKYSAWLAATPGDCIHLFMDYETFGEHHWAETGILEFLRWLPGEVLKYENLSFQTPSEVLERGEAVGVLDVGDFETLSWADVERGTGAWLGNEMQRSCYRALRDLGPYLSETGPQRDGLLKLWRYLQISDHLYYLYISGGASGIVHGYFSQQPPVEAFVTYATLLEDFQERVAVELEEPLQEAARLLRLLPPQRGMHFHDEEGYVGISAHSLKEFAETLDLVPERSLLFHTSNDDFERWVRFTVGDRELADRLREVKERDLSPNELKEVLIQVVRERVEGLEGRVRRDVIPFFHRR
jgi:alpha-amylase